ncbi:MAG: hypothetical protein ACR2MT_00235 [Aurantibacter sp.]
MDNEMDKRLDELTGKLLKDFSGETPSFDFTTQLMARVEGLSRSRITRYKPLISKKLWLILIVLIAGIFSYLIFGNVQLEDTWASSKLLDLLPEMSSFKLPDYQISNVLLYGVLGFTFFVGVQTLVLKRHFDKRFA